MRLSRLRPDLMAAVVLMAMAALLVGLHVRVYPTVSPIDELSHIDMLEKASRFEHVRIGDRVGQEAMREEACRGLDREDVLPPCDSGSFDPQYFQEFGENTVARKFPIYYGITGLFARLLRWATPIGSIVTAARFLNFVWLGAGLFITWLLMGELGVRRRARTAGLMLLATTPVVLHASATVNSDAATLLSGGVLTLLVLRWEAGRIRLWPAVVFSGVALLLEASNVVVISMAGAYLAFRAVQRRALEVPEDRRSRRRERSAILLGAALFLLLAVGSLPILKEVHERLMGFGAGLSHPPTPEAQAAQYRPPEVNFVHVTPEQIVGEIDALVTPVKNPFIPRFLSGWGTTLSLTVFDWLLLGSALACVARSFPGERTAALGAAVLVVMMITGPVHAMVNGAREVFFVTPARFGLALLPTLTALLGSCLEKRPVLLAVGAFAALATANALFQLI